MRGVDQRLREIAGLAALATTRSNNACA